MSERERLRGRVTSIRGTVLELRFEAALPGIGSGVSCRPAGRPPVTAEIYGHTDVSTARAIAIESTRGLRRGDPVDSEGEPIRVPVGSELLGRVIDLHGRPLDGGAPFEGDRLAPLRRPPPTARARRRTGRLYETGIKVIDLFCPIVHGGRAAV